MKIGFKSRAKTAPGATKGVALSLYERGAPDNGSVELWSGANQINIIQLPTNEYFQYDELEQSLVTWGLDAGKLYQFEITRDTDDAYDTLIGDWALIEIFVEIL